MKDFWAEELQNQRKGRVLKKVLLIILLLIILAIIIAIAVYHSNIKFRQWCDQNISKRDVLQKDTKYIEIDGNENVQVYAYEKYICVFRKKNLEFYNKVGIQVEKIELDINKAVFATAGRYMAICEQDGHKFYLICGKEKLFESKVEGNITQINVNKSGYISIVISNTSYKSIVDVFDKTGSEVFKTNLVSSRVVDVCISPDSKYLAIAEIDLSGVLIQSKIQVISMELAKKEPEKAIIYKYDAPIDELIMNIQYQERNKLICMYDDRIEVLKEEESTELAEFKNKKFSFMTTELSDRVVLVEEISTGSYTADTNIKILNPENLKEKPYITTQIAKSIETSDNIIAINFGTELHIINKNGILLKKYISETEINEIVMTDALVGIVYKDKIHIINL